MTLAPKRSWPRSIAPSLSGQTRIRWWKLRMRLLLHPNASGSATRTRAPGQTPQRSSQFARTSSTRRKIAKSTRTSGSQSPNGRRSRKQPQRSLAPSAAIISTPLWAALWATNAGSSIPAWCAAPPTRWWAITEGPISPPPRSWTLGRLKGDLP